MHQQTTFLGVYHSRPLHAVTVLPPLWWQKGSAERYMQGRFFTYPSTKLCPSCSPLEDSEFATRNQNPLGTTAWINQTTTIRSIRLGKKSTSPEQAWFSAGLGNSHMYGLIRLPNYSSFWWVFVFKIIIIKAKVFHQNPTGVLNALPAIWGAK